MNCQQCQDKMQQHVDRELFERKEDFEKHLKKCPDCAEELERLLKTTALFSNSLKPSENEQLKDNLWAYIESQIAPIPKSVINEPGDSLIEKVLSPLFAFTKRPAFAVPAVLVILILLTFKLFGPAEAPNVAVVGELEIQSTEKISDYPVVEKVHKPDVTVLTMNTSDPKIKVVWFFDENLKM
jgi:anti-sigma factor RsiW